MRQGFNTDQILINLVVSDEQINTSELTELWTIFKKQLLSDDLLRKECTTFLLTYNNTVSDAIRREDTPTDILWGQGYIFEELQFHMKRDSESTRSKDVSYTIEEGQIVEQMKDHR
jgi:hypothetical protein